MGSSVKARIYGVFIGCLFFVVPASAAGSKPEHAADVASRTVSFGCYARGASATADKLGVPEEFCIYDVNVAVKPFHTVLLSYGKNVSPVSELLLLKEEGKAYLARATIFEAGCSDEGCDRFMLTLDLKMDEKGNIDRGSLELSAMTGGILEGSFNWGGHVPLIFKGL